MQVRQAEETRPVQPVSDWATVNGLRLHHRSWSPPARESAPPVLLIHGLASASRIWDLTAPRLAAGRRVVAIDQRGHGLSDKPEEGYDFASIVADDLALIEALGLERPLVVGHSWGASVALVLAATRPAAVSGLVLVDGGVVSLRDRPDWTWERVRQDLAPPHYAGTPAPDFLNRLRSGMPEGMWRPELADILLNIVELRSDNTVGPRLSRDNHLRILRSLWDLSLDEIMREVRCPVTAVIAEGLGRDQRAEQLLGIKRRAAAQAVSRLSNAASFAVHWLAETVHDIPLQRPAELTGLITGASTL